MRQLLPWVSAAVLILATTIFVITVFGDSGEKSAAPRQPAAAVPQASATQAPKTGPLENGARMAAGKFILTAVARKNLGESWKVTHPELRAGYTLGQWKRGDIPVVPFPVDDTEQTRFTVEELYKNEVLVTVALIPRAGADQPATVFWMGLKATGAGAKRTWRVNYWMPRWNARVPNTDP